MSWTLPASTSFWNCERLTVSSLPPPVVLATYCQRMKRQARERDPEKKLFYG